MPDSQPILTVADPIYGGLFATPESDLPRVLPGEQVRLDPTGEPAILQASPDRVEPGCIHFGTCGGCHYQHASYPAQLALKQRILADLLAPLPHPAMQRHASPAWGYRNRIRLRVQVAAGALELGYSRWRSNDFLPIRMCPIAAPLLWQAAAALLQVAAADARLLRWLAGISAVELFTDAAETQLQLLFLVRDPIPNQHDPTALGRLAEQLQAVLPQLAGAGTEPDPEVPRRTRRAAEPTAWQRPGLVYPVLLPGRVSQPEATAGHRYWVPRGAFFQVNRFLLPELLATVIAGDPADLTWDLFAGVGLFAQALAGGGAAVVAVEGAPRAAEALAAASRNLSSLEAVHASTLDFLTARQHRRERPGLVVLDPPRAGLGQQGSELLARLAPARITYVSCDPTTLVRDLAVLVPAGYEVQEVHLFDLFPQTFHLETVVKLSRGNRSGDAG